MKHAGLDDVLHQAQLSRRLAKFEEALALLSSVPQIHPDVVFERFRVFEEMGDLRKCSECAESFSQTMQNGAKDSHGAKGFLIKLSAAYITCYTKGEWQNAMELALLANKDYLSGRTSYDVTTVCNSNSTYYSTAICLT